MAKTFDAVLAAWIAKAFVRLDAEGAPLFRWQNELVPTHEYLHRLLSFEPALMLLLEERVSHILHLGTRAVHSLNAQRRALGVPTTSHAPVTSPRPASPATPEAPVVKRPKVGSRFLVRPAVHRLTESELRAKETQYQARIVKRLATASVIQCQRCGRVWQVGKLCFELRLVRDWRCPDTQCRRARAKAEKQQLTRFLKK